MIFILLCFCCEHQKKGTTVVSGMIEAVEVTVSSEVSGRVIDIMFDEGHKLKKQSTLCKIDDVIYTLQYEQSLSAKAVANNQYNLLLKGARKEDIDAGYAVLEKTKTAFETAEESFERTKKLYKSGYISEEAYDQAKSQKNIYEAQVKEAKSRLKALVKGARFEEIEIARHNYQNAKIASEMAKEQLDKTEIKSPINGIVTNKLIEVGEMVTPGSPIAVISDLAHLYIRVYLNEINIQRIKLNDTVKIYLDAFPDSPFEGKIVYISPEAEFTPKNIQTRNERTKLMFGIKIKVINTSGYLKAGLPADAEIKLYDKNRKQ